MAGVDDEELYQTLATVGWCELERIGQRPSFRSKYVLQIVEKFAAAGVKGPAVERLHRVAAEALAFKDEHTDVAEMLRVAPGSFDLHATRSLLWLWRFSSKQRKVKLDPNFHERTTGEKQATSLNGGKAWMKELQDPTLPLIADIGCGMGVSLLGLASSCEREPDEVDEASESFDPTLFDGANFVGCDLSSLNVGYAESIGKRWDMGNFLRFCQRSAIDFVKDLEMYPGDVSLILIQFPTPYRLSNDLGSGNTQLPAGLTDGFMVSPELLRRLQHILRQSRGWLLFQSNVEDVAVRVKHAALQVGFTAVNMSAPVADLSFDPQTEATRLPQRTLEWVSSGGERAIGPTWSKEPLIPRRGATETEVACLVMGTPVHRFLLRAQSD